MAEKILMLALSPTMEEGHIAQWHKEEGDSVSSGDVLCEVETDKTTMDYEATSDGVLLKIVVPAGSQAKIGETIAIIGEAGEDISALLEETDDKKEDLELKPIETKPEPSPDSLEAGQDSDASEISDSAPEVASSSAFPKASPLARKLADMNGLNLKQIRGSGPEGRVIKADIENALKEREGKPSDAKVALQKPVKPTESRSATEDEIIPLTGMRKAIAQRLAESKYSAPHYYLKVSVEVDSLLVAHAELNKKATEKISLNAFFTKFVAEALKKHPKINASWQGDSIKLFSSVDIGTAVALKDGLITPVVRNCGQKGIIQIDTELKELIEKARSNALQPEEYAGASFTISNLGSFGIEDFTAIINPPGAAILAISTIKRKAIVQEDDSLAIRSVMNLSLSCDHRVIDGAVGAAFLAELKNMLESPVRALY